MISKNNQPIEKIYKGSVEIAKIYKGSALVYQNIKDMIARGINFVLIHKAKANSLNYLKRFGKCEQNGTPTPDIPVDIMCNNGTIKVGRETYTTPLGRTVYGGTLDVVTGELVVDRAMVDLGTLNWEIAGTRFKASVDGMPNKAGRTIKMLCDCYKSLVNGEAYDQNANNVCYGAYSSVYVHDFAYTDASIFKTAVTGHQLCYELATPQTYQLTPQTVGMIAEWSTFQSNASGNIDITYYANGILKTVSGNPVVITDADGQNAENVTVHIEPIQSGSGTPSPTNIRPISGMTDINITRLGGVVADDTPEVLTVCGKNLFDISAYDDERVWTGTAYKYIAIPLPNGTYTISWDKSKGGGFYWLVQVNGTKKGTSSATSGGSWLWHNTNTSLQKETVTFTVTEGYVYFSCSFGGYFVQKFLPALQTVQIEKGSTATAYEPYSAQTASVENLLAVGNYKDTQDIISGEVTKRIGVVVFDGTENWSFTTTPGGTKSRAYVRIDDAVKSSNDLLSNQLSAWDNASSNYPDEWRCFLNTTPVLIIGMPSTITTKEEWKALLAEQYANGNPVIVLYPLATEETESVTAQPVNIQKGTNTIQVTQASINDLELEIKYKGK